jgi:hypothetical protein
MRLGGAAAAAGLAWGHFEAGWVELETLRCPLPGGRWTGSSSGSPI